MTSPRTHFTTCNLCEAMCGLSITVDGGKVTDIRGDHDDTFSAGHICPKALGLREIYEDPDRLRQPQRRTPNGFVPISWDEALAEVASKLTAIRSQYGRNAIGIYAGNPTVHNLQALLGYAGFLRAVGTKNRFDANSQDANPRLLTSLLLYGEQTVIPVPDIDRTSYFLMLGANPAASGGSLMTMGDVKNRVRGVKARGGKLVLIDPRRSETSEWASEHHFIRPGGDAALLLAILHVLISEQKVRWWLGRSNVVLVPWPGKSSSAPEPDRGHFTLDCRRSGYEVKKPRIPRTVVMWITAALLGAGVKDTQAQTPVTYRAPERGTAHFTLPETSLPTLPTATSEGQIVFAGHPETAPTPEVTLTAQANVKVRPQANTHEANIYTLNKGSQAIVLEQNTDGERIKGNAMWYLIQLEDGREGWVWGGAVMLHGSLDTPEDSSKTQTASVTNNSEAPSTLLSQREQITTLTEPIANGVTLAELSSYPRIIRGTFEGLSEDGVKHGRRVPFSVEVQWLGRSNVVLVPWPGKSSSAPEPDRRRQRTFHIRLSPICAALEAPERFLPIQIQT